MLNQIQQYFEDRGITAADFPKALLIHELLSVTFLAATWIACYNIQPSQAPMFAPLNKAFEESTNRFVMTMRSSYRTMVVSAERRMGQSWLGGRGIDTGRLAVSLGESTLFRKLTKPITIPGKLWLTWVALQAMPRASGTHAPGKEGLDGAGAQAGEDMLGEGGRGQPPSSGRRLGARNRRSKAACRPNASRGECFAVPCGPMWS